MLTNFKEILTIQKELIDSIPPQNLTFQMIKERERISETLDYLDKKINVSLGRSVERSTGTIQNIQVYIDGNLIIDSDKNNQGYCDKDSGFMYLVINRKDEKIRISTNNKNDERYIEKDQAYVGNIALPEKYQKKGLGHRIYQAAADLLQVEIVRGDDISCMSQGFWEKHNSFKPIINNEVKEIG